MKGIAVFFILSIVFGIVSIGVGLALIWLIVTLFGDNRGFVAIVIIVGAVFWFLWVRALFRLMNLWLDRLW